MKKVLMTMLFVLAVGFTMMFSSCGGDKVITEDQLPETAKTYIQQKYPNASILIVKQNAEMLESTEYEVTLDNGLELKFNKEGMLVDVDN